MNNMSDISHYKVSICVPVYGVERYIERYAVSLFEQTYDNIEYIFVNDCTKDRSIEVLQEVVKRYPSRKEQVRIIHHETNKRLGEARNTAVSVATGEFLLHVDSDDYIDKNIVEECVAKQIETNADIVNVDFIVYSKNDIIKRITPNFNSVTENLIEILHRSIPVGIVGKMVRTSLYKDNNIKVEGGINCSEDFIVTSRLYYYAKNVVKAEGVYYHYDCRNEQSLTSSFSPQKAKDDFWAFDFLDNFFKNKIELYPAFLEGELNHYVLILKISALNNNEDCFNEAKKRLLALDGKVFKKLSATDRWLLKMNARCAKKYIRVGLLMKSFVRKTAQ